MQLMSYVAGYIDYFNGQATATVFWSPCFRRSFVYSGL